MVALINVKFIFPFLFAVFIFSLIIITITRKMLPLIKKSQEKTDGLINRVLELLSGIKVIRAVVKSKEKGKQFDDLNDEIATIMQRTRFLFCLLNPLTMLALNLIGVFTCGLLEINVTGNLLWRYNCLNKLFDYVANCINCFIEFGFALH